MKPQITPTQKTQKLATADRRISIYIYTYIHKSIN